MDWLQIIVLGIVQGVTEFLPVSSSGHLVIVEALFANGRQDTSPEGEVVVVNVLLHAGTLLAILVYYRRQVVRLLTHDRRVIGLLVVGTIPAAVIGLSLKYFAAHFLESPLLAGFMLPVTGGLLIWSHRHDGGEIEYVDLNWRQALLVGLFQAVALLPGLSRSGLTIVGGLAMGLKRESAATFSFLLAIPAISGATLIEAKDLLGGQIPQTPVAILLAGMIVAFVVGLASLWWLVRWLARGKLYYFAFWCIPLGLAVIVWQLVARFTAAS